MLVVLRTPNPDFYFNLNYYVLIKLSSLASSFNFYFNFNVYVLIKSNV